MRRRSIVSAGAASVMAVVLMSATTTGAAPPNPVPQSAAARTAQRFGVQQVPKSVGTVPNGASTLSSPARGANPLTALLPDPSRVDYAYWKAVLATAGKARAAQKAQLDERNRQLGIAPAPLLVDEQEPDQISGGNDSTATAEFIPQYGSAAGKRPVAWILGTLATGAPPAPFTRAPEDNGSIPRVGLIRMTVGSKRVSTTGSIGDGPHGSMGDRHGDFDFYKLSAVKARQMFVVDIDTVAPASLDSVVAIWDATGNILALNDDDGLNLDSRVAFTIPRNGDYYVSVGGFPSALPNDPFNSGSGTGVGSEGPYTVIFGLDADDVDVYGVDLRAGDVLGASVTGAATDISVVGPLGTKRVGSRQDASGIYPGSTPLPGGGNAVLAHVAAVSARHYIAVTAGAGNYDITLEVYRPGPESIARQAVQTIFLDFDGARVNTAIFGGPGVRQLSPFRAFLGRWGLTAAQENAVINRIVNTVKENLANDFGAGGVGIRILNSRDNADQFGKANVSRIIVGGTIAESGIPTIGISQSIDPGNFELEETSLVLLDVLSDPAGNGDPDPSLNVYLKPQSDKVRFVGTAIGNVVSHEAGHFLGSFHVDQFNAVLNLMDQGGNFPLLYGVGADGVGGTADDRDVDFGTDTYNPFEGFVGSEDTAANTKWGLSPLRN